MKIFFLQLHHKTARLELKKVLIHVAKNNYSQTPLSIDTRLIRTLHYDSFALSLEKETFSLNLIILNTDTFYGPLIVRINCSLTGNRLMV